VSDQQFDLAKALQSDRVDWEFHAREQKATADRRLKWLKIAMQDIEHCPECHEHEADGHTDDCELDKELADAKKGCE